MSDTMDSVTLIQARQARQEGIGAAYFDFVEASGQNETTNAYLPGPLHTIWEIAYSGEWKRLQFEGLGKEAL